MSVFKIDTVSAEAIPYEVGNRAEPQNVEVYKQIVALKDHSGVPQALKIEGSAKDIKKLAVAAGQSFNKKSAIEKNGYKIQCKMLCSTNPSNPSVLYITKLTTSK